jgi:subtilisin-like proprotein convertase family protein/V8-like Glu-specific endopeptidase
MVKSNFVDSTRQKPFSKIFSSFSVTFVTRLPLLLVRSTSQPFWSRTMTKRNKNSRRQARNQAAKFGFGKLEDRKLMAAVIGGEAAAQDFQAEAPTVQTEVQQRIEIDNATQRIVNGEQTSDYEAVGYVGPLGCTGTLISPTHVLTAAHCTEGVGNTQGSFEVGGQTYNTTRIHNHPDYNPNDFSRGDDLAIMELDRPVDGVTPMQIFRQTPQVGTMLTLVGFGEGGTSTGGFDSSDTGKQVGQTELEEVTNEHIAWNFDKHTESNTAPGDSGGPAFIQSNGQFLIAGVTSGGDGDAHTLGDYSFDTRIDVHAAWIDGIVGSTDGGDDGNDGDNDDDNGDDGGDNGSDDHSDTANNAATKITLNNGVGKGTGTLEEIGDRDAFKFTISEDGQTSITLTENGSDVDTYLRVYDSAGKLIGQNDDFGNSLNSKVTKDLEAGNYFAVAGSYEDSETGDFELQVKHTANETNEDYTTFSSSQVKEISEDGRDRVWTGINVKNLQGKISDLNITVDIDHSWVSDLRLILVAPDRTRVVLVNRQGDDGQNFESTTFDRQATQHINRGEAPYRGTFRPAHNLNKLNGMNANGRWYLVAMDFADGEGGQINGWSMDIKTDASRDSGSRTHANFATNSEVPAQTCSMDSHRRLQSAETPADQSSLAGADVGRLQTAATVSTPDTRHDGDSAKDNRRQRMQLLDNVFSDQLMAGV